MTELPRDLVFKKLPPLSWAPQDQVASLEKMAEYVSNEAQTAIGWYLAKKGAKKRGATFCRVAALVLVTVSGLIPILAEIWQTDGKPDIAPGWASAALVLAVACVGLDRFYGYSSAWMRFLTTEMQIRHALHEFHLDWEIRRTGFASGQPTGQQLHEGLLACRTFLTQLNTILKDEMNTWVQEFSAAIQEIDRAAKTQAQVLQTGSASITVINGDRCASDWKLSIDGGAPVPYQGKTAALRSLAPGTHTVRVAGAIDGSMRQAEGAFAVSAGGVAVVELTLA